MKQRRILRVSLPAGRVARNIQWRNPISQLCCKCAGERDHERICRDNFASPPPGIGSYFATIQEPMSSQRNGFRMLSDSGASRPVIDDRLMAGVEGRMKN